MPDFFSLIKYWIKPRTYLVKKNYNKAITFFQKFFLLDFTNATRLRFTDYDKLLTKLGEKIFAQKHIQLEKVTKKPKDADETVVLILNSEIYDTGGHTEIALRFTKNFKEDFPIYFLLTGFFTPVEKVAPIKSKLIKENVSEFKELPLDLTPTDKVVEIYNYIMSKNISTIIVNIHMFDVASAIALGIIKKYTDINILFWNHSDHSFSLGTSFADTMITRTKDGKPLLNYLKKQKKLIDFLFLEQTNEPSSYSQQEIDEEKEKLGIRKEAFVTLTGAIDYKIFSDTKQPYLRLIKRLLEANPNMVHIIMGVSYEKNKTIIEKIIGKYLIENKRLIFLEPSANFDFYINISDLYIDSFPQGSALTLIDYTRNAKPVVCKVNEKDPIKSFQMYLEKDYKYACKTLGEMFDKINLLITDKNEYTTASKNVRVFYLERYGIEKIKAKYLELIKLK